MSNNIWIPLHKRLAMLVYRPPTLPAMESGVWEVWMSTSTRAGDSSTWFGEYVEVHENGDAFQCIRKQDGTETRTQVR
jgi:hypothetical protein